MYDEYTTVQGDARIKRLPSNSMSQNARFSLTSRWHWNAPHECCYRSRMPFPPAASSAADRESLSASGMRHDSRPTDRLFAEQNLDTPAYSHLTLGTAPDEDFVQQGVLQALPDCSRVPLRNTCWNLGFVDVSRNTWLIGKRIQA